mgnify:CR=1 FL=1
MLLRASYSSWEKLVVKFNWNKNSKTKIMARAEIALSELWWNLDPEFHREYSQITVCIFISLIPIVFVLRLSARFSSHYTHATRLTIF